MTLDTPSILTIIGLGITLFGCTWRISAQMTKSTAATNGLKVSVQNLEHTFEGHVTESNDRDRANLREHAMLNRCCDSNVEAIKSLNIRMERTERRDDAMNDRMDDQAQRIASLEARA